MSPLGLGNDLGGSLRNPAHCCGIASIKPSTGVVPHALYHPPEDPLIMFQLMAVEGPMARRVADLRVALLADGRDAHRDPLSLPVVRMAHDWRRLRVAVLTDPPGGSTDPGITAAIRGAADVLTAAAPTSQSRTALREAIDLWGPLLIKDIRRCGRSSTR